MPAVDAVFFVVEPIPSLRAAADFLAAERVLPLRRADDFSVAWECSNDNVAAISERTHANNDNVATTS